MILIADSGSSKTDWYLIRKDQQGISLRSEGLNPYFTSSDKAESILMKEVTPLIFPDKVTHVYFYGAGCSRDSKRDFISDILKDQFYRADIEVYPDILGAAKALFDKSSGIAGILGTGSNLCLYNGQSIDYTVPSLGYILGDEGSGTSLGFSLLRAFLREELPEELLLAFNKRYQLQAAHVMDAIYHQPFPNRWAARFTTFMKEHIAHPYMHETVLNSFRYFVYKNLAALSSRHEQLPIAFCGAVAFHFQELLKKAASEKGIDISLIVNSPLEGLVKHHTPKEWV